MIIKKKKSITRVTVIALLFFCCNRERSNQILDHEKFANQYYDADAQWYVDNIPFFECSDKQIEEVYYYRWKMYKAHIRNVGTNRYVITEFINHADWG